MLCSVETRLMLQHLQRLNLAEFATAQHTSSLFGAPALQRAAVVMQESWRYHLGDLPKASAFLDSVSDLPGLLQPE